MTETNASKTRPSFSQSQDKDVSLLDVLASLTARWKIVAAVSVVGVGLSIGYALLLKPTYRAQTVVVPVANESGGALSRLAGQLGPLSSMVGDLGLGSSGGRKEVALATLKSRALLEAFIKDEHLLPVLFEKNWDPVKKKWLVRDGRSTEPTMGDAVLVVQNSIVSVAEDKRSGLITVAAEWRDPTLAARWANRLVEITNSVIRQRVIDENQRNIAYLEAELKSTNIVDRQQIMFRLIESRTSEIMMAKGRPEYAFTIVDPAVPPDANKPHRPKRRLIVLTGGALSMFVGVAFALVLNIWGMRQASFQKS
jgi:uncharacterized protein involved in exopolysaccharide biosynthesis